MRLLAKYVDALTAGLEASHRAEERPEYTRLLSAAAEMFAAMHHANRKRLAELVATDERAFGWGYLGGTRGRAAEDAFRAFAACAHQAGAAT